MKTETLQKENEILKSRIVALETEKERLESDVSDLSSNNSNLLSKVSQLSTLTAKLEEQVSLLQLLHFGTKSEKMTSEDKKTASLFNEAEDAAFKQQNEEEEEKVTETCEVKSHPRRTVKKAGRTPIDESVPREVKEYDIDEEDKTCACGTALTCIGEDVTERLKLYPIKVTALQERKKKYVCRNCEGLESEDEKGVHTAEGPKHLIPGSVADESLIAWSIAEKFEYALPFYRQSKRFGQIGAPIPRATLSNLSIKASEYCEPIYTLLKENILKSPVINADETRVQVLGEPGRKNQSKSWMWVFMGGEPDKKSVIFQYKTGRSHEIPYDFLSGYSGWLQTDDYEAYHTAVRKLKTEQDVKINHVLCWAHARRRFYQYWESSKDKDAKKIIELIKQLFELEDLRSKFSEKGFVKQRRNRAGPIFDSLKQLLMDCYPQTPPSLSFGRAISYTLDNWEQLVTYVDHPYLTPSNNAAERAIRPFVIGRKNWLFSGSPKGAKGSAILYSLVESAKLHGLSAFEYLHYIFRKIPYCQSSEDYAALLPFNASSEQLKLEG